MIWFSLYFSHGDMPRWSIPLLFVLYMPQSLSIGREHIELLKKGNCIELWAFKTKGQFSSSLVIFWALINYEMLKLEGRVDSRDTLKYLLYTNSIPPETKSIVMTMTRKIWNLMSHHLGVRIHLQISTIKNNNLNIMKNLFFIEWKMSKIIFND